jgi:hypothetical protein
MATAKSSLLAGRNNAPLTPHEVTRAINTFLGFDEKVSVRFDADSPSAFHILVDETNTQYGEIVFGPDIYPGSSVVDPNSALSLPAAAAHELTHYHRWMDKATLTDEAFEHVEEALTSLMAIIRYDRHLNENDVRQLVADAIQRLQLFVRQQTEASVDRNLDRSDLTRTL